MALNASLTTCSTSVLVPWVGMTPAPRARAPRGAGRRVSIARVESLKRRGQPRTLPERTHVETGSRRAWPLVLDRVRRVRKYSMKVAGLGSALPVWILASHVNACQRLLCPLP